jgi:dTDP-4-dehydrorhamnose reductase
MILLLGAAGDIGQAFARELRRQGECFVPLSRKAFDYTSFEMLFDYVRKLEPEFIINAEGTPDAPAWAAEESDRLEALQMNTLVPQTVSRVCMITKTPWAHLSSGTIYTGAKLNENGRTTFERDLGRAEIRRHFDEHPEHFLGFTECDEPNCCFRHPPCSFISGTRALAEEAIRRQGQNYIWRLLAPFDEQDRLTNWLSQLQRPCRIQDTISSLSHLEDCVRAGLELWRRRAPFGTYHLTNPGVVTTRQVADMIQKLLKPAHKFKWLNEDIKPFDSAANTLWRSCILDSSKLLKAGVELRQVTLALKDSLGKWQPGVPATGKKLKLVEPARV